MTLFLPVKRATLLIPSGQTNHLFILLTDPIASNVQSVHHTLIVGLASVRQGRPYDSTCILYKGDHTFIQHDSYVNYYFATIEETQKLINGCKQGIFNQRDNLESAIFARVAKGLVESRHTPLKAKLFYEAAKTNT